MKLFAYLFCHGHTPSGASALGASQPHSASRAVRASALRHTPFAALCHPVLCDGLRRFSLPSGDVFSLHRNEVAARDFPFCRWKRHHFPCSPYPFFSMTCSEIALTVGAVFPRYLCGFADQTRTIFSPSAPNLSGCSRRFSPACHTRFSSPSTRPFAGEHCAIFQSARVHFVL